MNHRKNLFNVCFKSYSEGHVTNGHILLEFILDDLQVYLTVSEFSQEAVFLCYYCPVTTLYIISSMYEDYMLTARAISVSVHVLGFLPFYMSNVFTLYMHTSAYRLEYLCAIGS